MCKLIESVKLFNFLYEKFKLASYYVLPPSMKNRAHFLFFVVREK